MTRRRRIYFVRRFKNQLVFNFETQSERQLYFDAESPEDIEEGKTGVTSKFTLLKLPNF